MNNTKPLYHGYRFPQEIISRAVWLYHRFSLSYRDVEDLLAERGIEVSYESIRQWCNRFGPKYARNLTKRRDRLGDTWYLDEVFVVIRGEPLTRTAIQLTFWFRNGETSALPNAFSGSC